MNSTTCWMIQTNNTSFTMRSTLWGTNMTFWAAGGILIIVSIWLSDSKWKQKPNRSPPRTSSGGYNSSKSRRNFGQLLSQNEDKYSNKWGTTPILWPENHLKCLNPNLSQFPPWNSYITNNHDQHHPLLQSPCSTLRNHLPQHQVLRNIQHHQLMTLHHFQFLHLLCFKFPLSTIIMVDHTTIDIVQNWLMSQEAVLRNRMEVPDLLLSPYESPIDNEHNEHHMNRKDAHFRKYGSGLLLWDTHLCWIWNLQTRMGVMLWSLIWSGTGTILSSPS